MNILRLTKYGWPQVVFYPLIVVAIMAVLFLFGKQKLPAAAFWSIQFVLLVFFLWQLSFFRDPERKVPAGDDFLISPADGKVTDIQVVDEPSFIGGKATRIGIFLSVFNVHVNRVPCDAKVEKVSYRPGKFKDARSPECGRVNESNDLFLTMLNEPGDKLVVRQISGAIARRIVCEAKPGNEYQTGERFGMIKYGSRTELYVPVSDKAEIVAKIGDKVQGGLTKLVVYSK